MQNRIAELEYEIGRLKNGEEDSRKKIRQQRMLLREVAQIAHFGGWEFDPVTLEGTMTEETRRILNLEPGAVFSPHMLSSFCRIEFMDVFKKAIHEAIEDGIPFDHELEMTTTKGVPKWVRIICHPLVQEARVIHIRGSIQDISEQKRTALELQTLAEAVGQASDGILITNVQGVITYVNPAIGKISGYGVKEMLHQNIRSFLSDGNGGIFYREFLVTLLKGQRWTGRINFKRKEGAFVSADVSVSPLKNKQGRIVNFVCIIRDISSALKIEERLSQAQKMEAIGTLAGGIAHDFNNILSPLIGYAELLKLDLPADSLMRSYVDQILQAASRAGNLVRQILTFSRQSDSELMAIKLQPIVSEALKLLRSSIPSTIDMAHHIESLCGPVIADATQVHQIVMNLVTNAYQSMEELGGRLTVSLSQIQMEAKQAKSMGLSPGQYACLSVKDTGTGIERDIREKIFDPYFSTKEKTKGTGLGLSVVQGIVRSCRGHIQVFSEPGQGSEFEIYLPVIDLGSENSVLESEMPAMGGTECILLVDDEERVALVTQTMLERLGYQVVMRVSSPNALELFKTDPDRYDLIITDMTMPKMTGDILAREIKKIRPELPVIICTGFSERVNSKTLKESGIEGFLDKPISASALANTIRKLLGASGSHAG